MNLIKTEDPAYEAYEALLLERDQLRKEAGQVWTVYMRLFGQLLTRIYEEKLACIERKKAIAYCQQAINRGGQVEREALKAYLDGEMRAYHDRLAAMLKDYEACKTAGKSTAYEATRARTLYRRLAKRLHPDLNPATEQHQALRALWQRVMTAYGHNDVKTLAELEVLAEKALRELGTGGIRVEVPDIGEKMAGLQEEIEGIRSTEPWILKALVTSEEAVRNKTLALEEELENCRRYRAELDGVLQAMLDEGGITIQ